MKSELDQLEGMADQHGNVARPNGNQHYITKRYTMPKWAHVRGFVMRELAAPDQLQSRILADKRRSSAIGGDNVLSLLSLEQFESMRLAFVEVDGLAVNTEIPYQGLDTWTLKMLRFAQAAFSDLNGVEDSDLENFTASAETVMTSGKTSTVRASVQATGT